MSRDRNFRTTAWPPLAASSFARLLLAVRRPWRKFAACLGNAALQVLAVLLIAFSMVSEQAGQRTSGSRVVIGLGVAALFSS